MRAALFRSLRARPLVILLALVAFAALALIGWRLGEHWNQPEVTARPALWHIVKGDRQAWLFGTIHAVPQGERWFSPAIARAADSSDRLILEVTGLDAERRSRAIFERLGRSPGLPAMAARLTPADAAQYRTLAQRHPAAFHGLDGYESWAAALLVNASASSNLLLSADEAGEALFTHRFAQVRKPIQGLETIEQQLGLFDRLPEADQRLLLAQAVREADEAAQQYTDLHDAWARGDIGRLERQFLAPLASAPGLRRTLIDARNRRWALAIEADLVRRGGTAFVAVGAGHLLGPKSVQAHLAARGWQVVRVQ
jgi:uncharacterized protein YbaP (TraB family)